VGLGRIKGHFDVRDVYEALIILASILSMSFCLTMADKEFLLWRLRGRRNRGILVKINSGYKCNGLIVVLSRRWWPVSFVWVVSES
jgi:hypothetical protein